MKKSLMVLGGTGFFGKTILDSYLKNGLNKYNINNLILVGNQFNEIKKIFIKSKKKKKVIFLKLDLKKAKKLPYSDYIIYAAEYVSYNKILKNYKNNNSLKTLNNCFKILSNNLCANKIMNDVDYKLFDKIDKEIWLVMDISIYYQCLSFCEMQAYEDLK